MNKIQNSKILVTGGAGFIGSNLVDALVADNEIVVVDDLSMGKVENLPQSSNLHFFKHSITDSDFMEYLLLKWQFDYVFLLAAVASVADTVARPLETHQVNQNANLNVLETIRVNKLDVKKVLFASSAAVYGNNPEIPKREGSSIDPLSPYAIDKFATERFVIDYGKLYDIPTVCTRFFNVFGPRQNPESPYSGVLSIIKKAVSNKSKFIVYGDGTQTRDFVFVDDVVKAMILLMTTNQANGDVYNVATGYGTSLNTVIRLVEEVLQRKAVVKFEQNRSGDVKNSVASIQKIAKLGFTNSFDLKSGLIKYLKG